MKPTKLTMFFILLGLIGVLAGMGFKLNHLMGAEELFNAGLVVLIVGLGLWAIAVLRGIPPR